MSTGTGNIGNVDINFIANVGIVTVSLRYRFRYTKAEACTEAEITTVPLALIPVKLPVPDFFWPIPGPEMFPFPTPQFFILNHSCNDTGTGHL